MTIIFDDVIKLLLALLVGGLIGAEREFRDKSAYRPKNFPCGPTMKRTQDK